ncbi:MAG: hypothetical protein O6952_00465, partial [Planctomycetota bacterium]|nr:hypothetical protein [Planctomycetota bacterium]
MSSQMGGEMRQLRVSRWAIAVMLSVAVGCSGGSSSSKRTSGNLRAQEHLACSEITSGTLEGSLISMPSFTEDRSLTFHTIDLINDVPAGVTAITVRVTSTIGNADLYLAAAGSSPRSTDPLDYVISSAEAPPVVEDWVRISLTGLESPGSSIPSNTLQDYQTATGLLHFAVWAVSLETTYQISVICESVLQVICGQDFTGSLPGSGQAPPDLEGNEVQFFEVPALPATSGTVSIFASSLSGDVNIYLGRPGLTQASKDIADYIFSSAAATAFSAADMIVVDGNGLHDLFGATNPTVTLADYTSAGSSLWFALAGLEASNDYSVNVSCSDVVPLDCGDVTSGAVQGSMLTTPDLTNSMETAFDQLEPLPSTAMSVTIDLDSVSGDADLHLAAPGAPPGSTDIGDYIFASTERSPTNQDRITIDFTGLANGTGGTSTTANLADYLASGVPIGLVVAGFDALSSIQISVSCVAPPLVVPLDCGGSFSGTIMGSG